MDTTTWVVLIGIVGLFWAAVGYGVGQAVIGDGLTVALACLMLGPFGLLLVFLMPDARPRCAACRNVVDPQATVCAACRGPLIPGNVGPAPQQARTATMPEAEYNALIQQEAEQRQRNAAAWQQMWVNI